jgi:hypothetical protein
MSSILLIDKVFFTKKILYFTGYQKRPGQNNNNNNNHLNNNSERKHLNSQNSTTSESSINNNIAATLSTSPSNNTESGEGRRPIKLLPRTLPVASAETPYNTSIFGSGKARDVTNPEMRKLEERLEKTLKVTGVPDVVPVDQSSS